MQLSFVDWVVVLLYFALNLGIGFYYYRRASGNVSEFFLSGRSVPWWLAGTSMVATTFAADTPLVVTGFIYSQGISGNWVWWSLCLSGMMTVFFFAPLWRRANVLTDMEFAEIRYSGKPSAFLRGFRALYLVFLVNTITMGWVNLGMAKVLHLTLGLEKLQAVFLCLVITLIYSAISGLWAVLWTDMVQFVLKLTMVIVLAYFAVHAAGGMDALTAKVRLADLSLHHDTLAFVPSPGSAFFLSFLVLMSVNWWSTSYPGAEPGGGGYITQRIFSAKNEKHSLAATLWFNVAHYALRPWPWILTALVALVVFPTTADKEGAYIQVLVHYLPASLRGLMLAGFAAAYMSTIATQLNLGASYLVNDVYRRFLSRDASDHHYVLASRWATVLVALASAVATYFMTSIGGAWKFLLSVGAGTGLVFILRWFWWRINAWTEISAMCAAAVFSQVMQSSLGLPLIRVLRGFDPSLPLTPLNSDDPHGFAWMLILGTVFTTIAWLIVTLLTPPEPYEKLKSFYDRVRPASFGWRPIVGDSGARGGLRLATFHWVLGCALIYLVLFGTGKLLFGNYTAGFVMLAGAVAATVLLFWSLERHNWDVFQ